MLGLFIRVLEKGKYLCNKMAELATEVDDGFSFDLYTGVPLWAENREVVTLRNTGCDKSTSQSLKPGQKLRCLSTTVRRRDEMNAVSSGS